MSSNCRAIAGLAAAIQRAQVTRSRVQQGDWWPVTLHESDGCVWRGQVLPTPLTRLRWWRVCLDEAQMVETTTAKAAMIAVQLRAQHRCARLTAVFALLGY